MAALFFFLFTGGGRGRVWVITTVKSHSVLQRKNFPFLREVWT